MEVEAIRIALGLGDFHLFGSSWGGLLAIEYAATRPHGLRSVTLSSPVVSVPVWCRDAESLKKALPREVQEVIAYHESQGYFDCPEYTSAVLEFWKRHVCRISPWPQELEASFAGFGVSPYREMWGPSEFTQTGNLKGHDATSRLSDIHAPTLWTCGRYDEARPDSTEHFHSLMQDSQFVVFEESSHMAHIEEQMAYLATLREFLGSVDGR